uniref:dUTP diphosphatase n=1 Tax=viral metagenome TaxID=1070528 RepID=A0A6C0BKY1_9ZZZZ
MELLVQRLTPDAVIPARSTQGSIGYDLSSTEDIIIPAKSRLLVGTGLSMIIPSGHYGRIAPRSGLAYKSMIDIGAGVIDSDYRGEVKVLMINSSNVEFQVTKGMRIAQLILERASTPDIIEVGSLDETERSNGGFGSTGL